MPNTAGGIFITFEGTEGSGKSTQMALVAGELERGGRAVLATREPGGDEVGTAIREILLHGPSIEPKAEVMLFLADRAQHVAAVIRPALASGHVVLCDRYIDSTLCYQGYARGFALDLLRTLNEFVTDGLMPDLTLVYDLPPQVGLERRRKVSADRLDAEELEFHERVRAGFRAEAKAHADRVTLVDADRSIEAVYADTLRRVSAHL